MHFEAPGGQVPVFRPGPSVVGERMNRNATTRGEQPGDFDIFRVHEPDQIFHDDIDAVFMEVAMIPETEKI